MASSSSSSSNNPTAPNINVPIRIEPTDEYKIQEISYDGQEKYIPPLSMSEHLSQSIARIDFSQPLDELREELEAPVAEHDGATGEHDHDNSLQQPTAASATQSGAHSWPFDSMRTKIRTALVEICVLNDVLVIAKEKKYMVFDAVNPKQSDQRPIIGIMAKKRALGSAAQVLIDGSTTLRATTAASSSIANPLTPRQPMAGGDPSTPPTPRPPSRPTSLDVSGGGGGGGGCDEPNFYHELREMRQNWRLKRVGNVIVGDLSDFRPVGHRFMLNSRFEVIKTNPATRGPSNQALAVRIHSDLEGSAHIQVSIVKHDELSLLDLSASANGRSYEALRQATTWQQKLATAQNVLFCKELFAHLATQAVQYQFNIPTTVTGNQIILALFPDIKLYITLVHKTPNAKKGRKPTEGMERLQRQHREVFEHSLHQMFRDFYTSMLRKMQARDVPREAGPCALDKQSLFELSRQESSLEKIVQQAQHLIMRHQTIEVIDTFASKMRDPLIISHWFCLNSPTTSIVRVDIVSQNNEILGRSHMLIYIGTRQLRVITRDCKNLLLGYEPDELRHLLVWQACLHQFIASDKLSKLLGWYTLILNYNVNVTRQDISSTAFSLVICSSHCSHMISMKSGPQFGLTVEVARFKDSALTTPAAANSNGSSGGGATAVNGTSGIGIGVGGVPLANVAGNGLGSGRRRLGAAASPNINGHLEECDDLGARSLLNSMSSASGQDEQYLSKLPELVENFREVDWDMMEGRDFLTKLELLMAALTELS